jgi:dihydrofolate synthase/folylpolyglutamate synthase
LLDALEAAGIAAAPSEARRRGYAEVHWPGRLELLTIGGRDVLLDGAHNPAGAAALAKALDDLQPHLTPGPPTLVMASMADKDVDGVIEALAGTEALRGARVVTTAVDAARAEPAEDLARRWRRLAGRVVGSVEAVERVDDALDRALGSGHGPVVVAGSLYLVGAARARLVDDPELRDP